MTRNQGFVASHDPLRAHPLLKRLEGHTTGPFSFLNPTRAHYRHNSLPKRVPTSTSADSHGANSTDAEKDAAPDKDEEYVSNVEFKWRSRDNRKGRHALVVQATPDGAKSNCIAPKSTSTIRATAKGIWRMMTQYPYWDVSWLVATIFTLGSVVWCINGFFSWLPYIQPSSEFPTEVLQGGGITAFIGATIFEIGSVLLMFEAVNENRAGCFGWAIEQVLEGGRTRIRPDKNSCSHHHINKKNFVGRAATQSSSSTGSSTKSDSALEVDAEKQSQSSDKHTWQWCPSTHELTTHYLRDIGFLACLAQLFGASVFWISGFTALPGIQDVMSQGLLDGIFWTPQIIGGSGFIVSGILFMLETQKSWYWPEFGVLGWHIGFWNFIGALGFTLCGALGPAYANSGAQYEASLATFWGSWAFLIGSLIQWFECMDTHPVEEKAQDE